MKDMREIGIYNAADHTILVQNCVDMSGMSFQAPKKYIGQLNDFEIVSFEACKSKKGHYARKIEPSEEIPLLLP
jgi:hypothetical protein